jgi:hypothetical protein
MLTKDDKTREYRGDGCLPKDKQAAKTDGRDERYTGSKEGETSSDQSEEEFVELMSDVHCTPRR